MHKLVKVLVFGVIQMISIKDYAQENGVSYEAVRQQVVRYKEELAGHIRKQGRTQYLDDVAVAILNDHRAQNPVVVYNKDAGEQLRSLQAKVEELTEENRSLLKALNGAKDRIIELQEAQVLLDASREEKAALQRNYDETSEALVKTREEALVRAQEAADAEQRENEAKRRADQAEATRKVVEDENHFLRQQIEQLQNRSRWDRFKDIFR